MTDSQTRTLVVRVWLPDRPGALGQVASRIGALHGDVTAIDILEQGGGRVVDELVVSLPNSASEALLAKELCAVDGVAVEHICPVAADRADSSTAMLDLAATVAEAPPEKRNGVLCRGLVHALDADWAALVGNGCVLAASGEPPEDDWLLAFLDGSHHLDSAGPAGAAPGDVVWGRLPTLGATFAAGRSARPLHARERSRATVFARIVDRLG